MVEAYPTVVDYKGVLSDVYFQSSAQRTVCSAISIKRCPGTRRLSPCRKPHQASPSRTDATSALARTCNNLGYIQHITGGKQRPARQSAGVRLEGFDATTLRAARIVGDKKSGDRILSDDELFAFERAAKRLRYPYGPAYQLLLRTGLRLNEVADAVWSEFDLPGKSWTIPAARMKGKERQGPAACGSVNGRDVGLVRDTAPFRAGSFVRCGPSREESGRRCGCSC